MSGQFFEGLERRMLFAVAPVPLAKQSLIHTAVSRITTTNSPKLMKVDSSATFTPATAQSKSLISLDAFRADGRFAGINGAGFSTVILDTGIDLNHPFFGPDADNNGISDRIVYQYDFAHMDANATDYNGHGSNVSSIVAGSDTTYMGMAPGANIIHLKVFQDTGPGNFGYTEKALQWVVANAAAYNIASVNMSLGDNANWLTSQARYGIGDELAALAAMDVIVVSAAGNDFAKFSSAQGVAYPAADANSLAVGAVYDGNVGGYSYASGARSYSSVADAVTPFSQRHASLLDVMAPGAPITGASHTGGTVAMHGTSQAAPHIAGIAVLMQQLAVQTIGRRLTVAEFRTMLRGTADLIVDGDDENDNVANTNLTFPRVNVLNFASAILGLAPPNAPEVQVFDGGVGLRDGASTLDFGATTHGTPIVRTLTVKNFGLQPLDLTGPITLPAGYSLVSSFGATTLAAGASTTFTVRLNASTVGTFGGTLSFASNDADESPFDVTLAGTVHPWATKLENTDAGFAVTGTWASGTGGSGGSARTSNVAGATATWSFTGLAAGEYRVYATWTHSTNRTTAAAFGVGEGSATVATATVNQQLAPTGLTANGVAWKQVAGSVLIAGGTLVVRLTAPGGLYAVADAIRIERVAALPSGPEITVSDGSVSLATGGSVSYGTAGVGAPVTRTFTVRNLGQSVLTLGAIGVPAGFSLIMPPGVKSLATGQQTKFAVRMNATSVGSYAGTITLANNDADESPFAIAVAGNVATVLTMDDGDAGFTMIGTWTALAGGRGGDVHASNVAGATATWAFTGLTPGKYRVSASWLAAANRTTAASYTILSGSTALGAVSVNQRLAPADRVDRGTAFKDLGTTFNITSTTLTVRLRVPSGGYAAVADAIRLERVGDLTPSSGTTTLGGAVAVDDGDAGVTVTSGRWITGAAGRGGDVRYTNAPGATHAWTVGGLAPGAYRVFASYTAGANRSGAASYNVYDGAAWRGGRAVDQRVPANDLTYAGTAWETIATNATVTGSTLTVRLTAPGGGYTIADAIYVQRVTPTVTNPKPAATSLFSQSTIQTDRLIPVSQRLIASGDGVL